MSRKEAIASFDRRDRASMSSSDSDGSPGSSPQGSPKTGCRYRALPVISAETRVVTMGWRAWIIRQIPEIQFVQRGEREATFSPDEPSAGVLHCRLRRHPHQAPRAFCPYSVGTCALSPLAPLHLDGCDRDPDDGGDTLAVVENVPSESQRAARERGSLFDWAWIAV